MHTSVGRIFFCLGKWVQKIKQIPEKMHQGKTMRGRGWVVFLKNAPKMHFDPHCRADWFSLSITYVFQNQCTTCTQSALCHALCPICMHSNALPCTGCSASLLCKVHLFWPKCMQSAFLKVQMHFTFSLLLLSLVIYSYTYKKK